MNTTIDYSPWDQLPVPEPKTVTPDVDYFYQNTAKHLIKDTVRIMNNGLPIDLDRVAELEETLKETLNKVDCTLQNNVHVKKYLEKRNTQKLEAYKDNRRSMLKDITYFIKPFKHSSMEHRSYFMTIYAEQQGLSQPSELLPSGVPKWDAKLVKKFSITRPLLKRLLAGELPPNHLIVTKAMKQLALDKQKIHNKKFLEQIENPPLDALPKEFELVPFNPGSSDQLRGLFSMLGLKSEATTDKGAESWNRKQVERVNKEFKDDPDIVELTQAIIDYSFGSIIATNFVPAFYKYTVNGRLHGTYKLFGAKSFRYTSSNPNMLNAPSTGSIYAKPVKRCFTAPDDFVVYAIDLSALEDRVIASLSRDTNKCAIFTEGLDGHCLNAYGYFKEEIEKEMTLTGDTNVDVKAFDKLRHTNKTLDAIRQRGKPATFGLSYGAFPPKVADTLKISVPAAEQIFNRYHNELYGGITDYRENYVLPTATANGRLHLGLGCYIKTDNPHKDIRTLNNATCQFWSIVTALTINKIHQLIDKTNYQNDIICTSTIYDSIYFVVRKDVNIIKWLNDRIVSIMTQDFMENQTIKNEAEGEIGLDWASLKQVPNNASTEEINVILKDL